MQFPKGLSILTNQSAVNDFQHIPNAEPDAYGLVECPVVPLRGTVIYPDVITPISVRSLVIDPTTVPSGATARGTVTLSAPAPPGAIVTGKASGVTALTDGPTATRFTAPGTVVALTSSDPTVAAVPTT